jgi:hypothetical protein
MADQTPTVFGPKATAQIAKTVREVSRRMMNSRARRGRYNAARVSHAAILDADLPVATNSKTGATSCLATICRWSVADQEYIETSKQITVWNHSETTSHTEDTFGEARIVDGHWWFFGDCEVKDENTLKDLMYKWLHSAYVSGYNAGRYEGLEVGLTE